MDNPVLLCEIVLETGLSAALLAAVMMCARLWVRHRLRAHADPERDYARPPSAEDEPLPKYVATRRIALGIQPSTRETHHSSVFHCIALRSPSCREEPSARNSSASDSRPSTDASILVLSSTPVIVVQPPLPDITDMTSESSHETNQLQGP
ncbi:hypothetical protein BC830DRAFT_1175055 [Chytriomyces sp. MP71]|nr:hypothetical protein BC830DRAFT_1175055 [Chytriomyces sp. MP71]